MERIVDIFSGIFFGTISVSISLGISTLIYYLIPVGIGIFLALMIGCFGIFLSYHLAKSIMDNGFKLFIKSVVNPPETGIFYLKKLKNFQ